MNRRFNLLLVSAVLVGAAAGGLLGNRVLATDGGEKQVVERFAHLVDVVESNYAEDVDSEEAVYGAIRGMLRKLDPHSNFLDPKTYKGMREEQRGHFSGLGIVVTKKGDRLTVISPIEDTPAYRLGIRAGDVISKIEGDTTNEMSLDEAVSRLKGAKGTEVTITLQRAGQDAFELTIVRDDIPTKSVSRSFMVSPSVGYLRIKNFTQTTADEVTQSLDGLTQQGMKGLVLDLRSNPGGLLDQAVQIGDLFVPKGRKIVYTKGRLPEANQDFLAKSPEYGDFPVVVLVNHGSASASEIVAGAIQDHDRGLVVGETTWGKGLVQSVYSLKYEAGLALTTAKYYTPSGRSIQRDYSNSFEDYYDYDPDAAPPPAPSKLAATDAGRVVYGGGGIAPDVELKARKLSELEQDLERKDVFFRFAVLQLGSKVIARDFRATDAVIREFREYLASEKIEYQASDLERVLPHLTHAIEERVLAAAFGLEEGARRAAETDEAIKKAIELMPDARELRERAQATIAKRNGEDGRRRDGNAIVNIP